MGLQLFFLVEEPIISMPKEGHTSLFQYEDHAGYIFRHSCNCSSQTYPTETACFVLPARRCTAKMP
jgi:hypothetical protein